MDKLSQITLRRVIPSIFAADGLPESPREEDAPRVWLAGELTFSRGEFYMVEAESGAGKSSLCAYLFGIRTDYEGTILFDGRDIRTLGVRDWVGLRRSLLAFLPQDIRLFPELTALENVMIKNRLTDFHTEAEIRQMLAALEVEGKADVAAGRLSAGQQQRVATVRALCQPYSFLLVDEPVSHLDDRRNLALASLIAAEASAQGAGIIATSVGNRLSLPRYTSMRL